MKILTAVLLALLAFSYQPSAVRAQSLVGLFELEEGARPLAMGGAFVALAEDEHAIFYNPAALASLKELYFSGLYESRFARVNYGTLALALPNFGGQLFFLGIPGISERDERAVPLGELPYGQLGLIAGAGLWLSEAPLELDLPLAVGLQLKIYRVNTLPEGSGTTLSLAPSLLWRQERLLLAGIPVQTLRFGLIASDLLSPGISYGRGHYESWGPGLRLGAAATLPDGLSMAFDVEANGTFHLGGEWQLRGLETLGMAELSVRLGLKNLGSLLAPSIGFGLRVNDFRVDYAFAWHPVLPGVHRISFSAVFGPPNVLLCALRPEFCPPDDPTH